MWPAVAMVDTGKTNAAALSVKNSTLAQPVRRHAEVSPRFSPYSYGVSRNTVPEPPGPPAIAVP
jgi:hypothetical protein